MNTQKTLVACARCKIPHYSHILNQGWCPTCIADALADQSRDSQREVSVELPSDDQPIADTREVVAENDRLESMGLEPKRVDPITEAQSAKLKKFGYTERFLSDLTKREASALIDRVLAEIRSR